MIWHNLNGWKSSTFSFQCIKTLDYPFIWPDTVPSRVKWVFPPADRSNRRGAGSLPVQPHSHTAVVCLARESCDFDFITVNEFWLFRCLVLGYKQIANIALHSRSETCHFSLLFLQWPATIGISPVLRHSCVTYCFVRCVLTFHQYSWFRL